MVKFQYPVIEWDHVVKRDWNVSYLMGIVATLWCHVYCWYKLDIMLPSALVIQLYIFVPSWLFYDSFIWFYRLFDNAY